jgi:hypothetical protein
LCAGSFGSVWAFARGLRLRSEFLEVLRHVDGRRIPAVVLWVWVWVQVQRGITEKINRSSAFGNVAASEECSGWDGCEVGGASVLSCSEHHLVAPANHAPSSRAMTHLPIGAMGLASASCLSTHTSVLPATQRESAWW